MLPKLLLHGFDTLECAYYLWPQKECALDFAYLAEEREHLRQLKCRDPQPITLGGKDFLFYSHGTGRGYPFLISNTECSIEFGEFNNPAFYVTYRSIALWHIGADALHQDFLCWVEDMGFQAYKPETLSRVDFTFDYHLPQVDFDEDSFVSMAGKDSQHRKNGKVQTFTLGRDEIVLRVYNKIDEINESSDKTWFHKLWGMDQDVWRIEWQVRKEVLRRFGIRSFQDLHDGQGDILRYLANEHDTLRVKGDDSNRSRWAVHPLWLDLQAQIEQFNCQGVYREVDRDALLNELMMRMAISIYGYLKRIGAVDCLQRQVEAVTLRVALSRLEGLISEVHDPLTWKSEVKKRANHIRLGQW